MEAKIQQDIERFKSELVEHEQFVKNMDWLHGIKTLKNSKPSKTWLDAWIQHFDSYENITEVMHMAETQCPELCDAIAVKILIPCLERGTDACRKRFNLIEDFTEQEKQDIANVARALK